MTRIAMIIEYEGTRYAGFQRQPNAPTIQEELEKAIARTTGEKTPVRGAGRTDAGVHAAAQMIAFDTAAALAPDVFVRAVNHWLPPDIAAKDARVVPDGFDPRRAAASRAYRYTILNAAAPSPLRRRFACHIRAPLDADRMRDAARAFVGTRDFRNFAAPPPTGRSTTRRVFSVDVERRGDELTIDIVGNAFLRRQARRMAGALADIGAGRMPPDAVPALLRNEPTDATARALPPQGLCLMSVRYAGGGAFPHTPETASTASTPPPQ